MPTPGTFTLHSRALPDLPAGPYTLHAEQDVAAPGAAPHTLDVHLEVTAPRFALPRDQVLSTFPPNQAQGAFSSILPQIVIRDRTGPWQRELDGRLAPGTLPRELPWLALVVLADGECEFRASRPVAECVTPGVVLEGRNDVMVGDAIVVTRRVVDQVFPTREELPLLAHVRNVDLADTELALGDDDGWLAVVLANRLPQPDARYGAYLISLEGQYEVLLERAETEPVPARAFATAFVYADAPRLADTFSYQAASFVDGSAAAVVAPPPPGAPPASESAGPAAGRPSFRASGAHTAADAWSGAASHRLGAGPRGAERFAPPRSTAHLVGALHAVDLELFDPGARQYTFPVLAHWQFTCAGEGDFQSLMQGLDVGMLGTLPKPPDPPQPGEKPPPPPSRPPPVVLDTGHVALEHVSRLGEPGTVWYRGPLVPRPVDREMPAGGVLPLLHASDQARRVGPDGRENLSLATAFEIGRLLALAEPGVVAALLNWRKEGFERARRTALLEAEPELLLAGVHGLAAGLASRAGHALIAGLGAGGAARMGAVRPPVDPGRPVPGVDDADLAQLLATGLGVPLATVREAIDPGAVRAAAPLAVPLVQQPTGLEALAGRAATSFAHLRRAATGAVAAVALDAQAAGAVLPGPAAAQDAVPDLDPGAPR
ncbi:MAG TPA: hypothetical protein VF746_14545 [Longimicrobium sp.]|jgi:hypothetical protein